MAGHLATGSAPRAPSARVALALICAQLLGAACTATKPPETASGTATKDHARSAEPWLRGLAAKPQSEAENLLFYFGWAQRLPAAEGARELDAARTTCIRQRSDFNCLRYALALDATHAPADPRLADWLAPIQKNRNSPLYALAQLLSSHDVEMRRQDIQIENLQKKLDALKNLEKNMSEKAGGGR
ncbi:MAG: hypothetical protein KF778_11690 [Rhodocyclaceae bacterium]|nr:hypothetical protein [Rhodocyclaceae bacterium]MBX3669058.1 hypothetical protein [Rhodocyclaceae bacterium]